MNDPQTTKEWQEAVDAAHVMLLVDSAEQYGLITGPDVNVERCQFILEEGRVKHGVVPAPDAVERLLSA